MGPSPGERSGSGDVPGDLDAQWAELTRRLGPLDVPEGDDGGPYLGTDGSPGSADQESTDTPPDGVVWGPRDYSPPADPEEAGFVPPDPGPVIKGASRNTLPWVGALGGPMVILAMLVFWPAAPTAAYFAAFGCTVAGLLTLWWRLPQRRRQDPDDGAVI